MSTILANENEIRTNSARYNEATLQRQLIHEEVSTAYNHHIIVEAFKSGRAKDLSDEEKKNGQPCIVLGSGPSLDNLIGHFKDWKGGIVCSPSQAVTLMHYGVEPDYIVSLDPFDSWADIEGPDWKNSKTTLILQPGVWPTLVENWPNRMLLYIENMGRPDTFYATTQKRMFTERIERGNGMRDPLFKFLIRTELTIFACSPPTEIICADKLGYGTVFLAGMDFGYPHPTKARFTKWSKDENGNEGMQETHLDLEKSTFIKGNNGVLTEGIHLYYKKNFYSAWRLTHQSMYSMDEGLLYEMPKANVERVIKTQGNGFKRLSWQTIDRITETYLASVGAFVVVGQKGGLLFGECADPEHDLPGYLISLHQQYSCDKCKAQMGMKDGADVLDHEGEKCAVCGEGKMRHTNPLDVKANMDRFKFLLSRIPKPERLFVDGRRVDDSFHVAVAAAQGVPTSEIERQTKTVDCDCNPTIAVPLEKTETDEQKLDRLIKEGKQP